MAPAKASVIRLKYTNRKSEGEKLAAIVAKDIRKPTTTFNKKANINDDDSAVLELDLDDKSQTDACINIIVPTLLNAFSCREGISAVRLEELSLQGNSITTSSLRALAPVIKAACFEIRDVDLSYNQIQVKTSEEAADFEVFLDAFAECEVMRRLDFSGNDFSGSLAYEVFLRVYCKHQPVDGSLHYYKNGPGSQSIDKDSSYGSTRQPAVSPNTNTDCDLNDPLSLRGSMMTKKVLQRRKGLRAIPYIILKNTKLTDSGALHLSYALENHYLPQFLLTKLKEGSKEAKRQEEDDIDGSFGIVYHDNTMLSVYGTKLLEFANAARVQLVGSSTPGDDIRDSWNDAMAVSTDRLHLPARARKASLQSISDISNTERRHTVPTVDFQSLRMRLQRTTLEEHGTKHGVQLWRAAFKVLYAARVMLPKKQTCMDVELPKRAFKPVMDSAPLAQQSAAFITKPLEATLHTASSFPRQTPRSLPSHMSLLSLNKDDAATGAKPLYSKLKERDARNPGRLPTRIWRRIFLDYAQAVGVLNEHQLDSIVRYAQDRTNLAAERQNQVKGESHQLWYVLDDVGCFTYELKTSSYEDFEGHDAPQHSETLQEKTGKRRHSSNK